MGATLDQIQQQPPCLALRRNNVFQWAGNCLGEITPAKSQFGGNLDPTATLILDWLRQIGLPAASNPQLTLYLTNVAGELNSVPMLAVVCALASPYRQEETCGFVIEHQQAIHY